MMSVPEQTNQKRPETTDVETSTKEWQKPVLTIMPANSAENSPGGWPDAGINYS
jgi:hypothetical protein